MKKKIAVTLIAAIIVFGSLSGMFFANTSREAHFIAVNDTLLPFVERNMPMVVGGAYLVPHHVFEHLGIYSISSTRHERLELYRGGSQFVNFHTDGSGLTTGSQNENLSWPAARRSGSVFYVPLRQVTHYFGLTYEIIEVGHDIIPHGRPMIIRIKSDDFSFNTETLRGRNAERLRTEFDRHFGIGQPQQPPPQIPRPPDNGANQPPQVEIPGPRQVFRDVLIYLSFYDFSAGLAERIVDVLDFPDLAFHASFFVTADEIMENPGLIRRIAGSGHTIGIMLSEGTEEEYLKASEILFEAAKVRTVIIMTDDDAAEIAEETAESLGLVIWGASRSFGADSAVSTSVVTGLFPTSRGQRANLKFACSENTAAILPGVLSFIRDYYTLARITETVEPIR